MTTPYSEIFEDDSSSDDNIKNIEAHGCGDTSINNDLPPHEQFLRISNNDHSVESTDKLLGMKVKLPHKGEMREGCITNRKRNSDGILIGTENNNPILDTRE